MKTYSQLILLFGVFLVFSPSLFAQNNTILLNLPESGAKEHVATEEIRLQPGYAYTANSSASMWAYIDETAGGDPVSYEDLYTDNTFNARAIDETLAVGFTPGSHSVSAAGGATYQVPIAIPPGSNGVVPQISLNYNSQSGNGLLGMGWNIGGLSAISRSGGTIYNNGTVVPVNLSNSDRFTFNGSVLVPIIGSNGASGTVYATEQESYVTVTSYGSTGGGPEWFKVETNDGMVMEYGRGNNARFGKVGSSETISWHLNKMYDKSTNYITYHYQKDGWSIRISEIRYTGNSSASLLPYNKIKFIYGNRSDQNTVYFAGAKIRTQDIVTKIEIDADGQVFKKYHFKYGKDLGYSFLKSVREEGTDGSKLNSTIFKYGETQSYTTIASIKPAYWGNHDYMPGDFDGDGYTDLLRLAKQSSSGSRNYYTGYRVEYSNLKNNPNSSNTFTGGGGSTTGSFDLNTQVFDEIKFNSHHSIKNSDFNGDGKTDFLSMTYDLTVTSPNNKLINCNGLKVYTSTGRGFTEKSYELGLTARYNAWIPINGLAVVPGDFDGDGAGDFILTVNQPIPGSTSQSHFHSYLYTPSKSGKVLVDNVSFIGTADKVNSIDLDGDGKQEVMIIKHDMTYVYSYDGTSFVKIYEGGYPTKWHTIEYGDFNGDGKTDLLATGDNVNWYIGYSTGKSWTEKSIDLSPTPTGATNNLQVADFNGDGKTDILLAYHVSGTDYDYKMHYSTGNHKFEVSTHAKPSSFVHAGWGNLIPGDYTGDGKTDLWASNASSEPSTIWSINSNDYSSKLEKVKNGFNQVTKFEYDFITRTDIYTKGTSASGSLRDYQGPIQVVKEVMRDNGVGGLSSTEYKYSEAIIHTDGRGLLGFKTVKATSEGKISISNHEVDETYFVMYPTTSEIRLLSDNSLIKESSQTTDFKFLGINNGINRFIPQITASTSTNHLTGFTNTTTNIQYGTHGQPINSESDNGVETSVTATNYTNVVSSGTPVWRKTSETITSGRAGQPFVIPKTVDASYNNKGQLIQQVKDPGYPKSLTTNFQYDMFGNRIQVTVSAIGLPNKTVKKVYDVRGQFVIEHENELGQKTFASYDSKWGKTSSSTSLTGQVTSFEYDVWGIPIKSILPNGKFDTKNNFWSLGTHTYESSVSAYRTEVTSTLGVKSNTWYDILGRSIIIRDEHPSGVDVTSQKTYTSRGQEYKSTEPFFFGSLPSNITVKSYDDYGRSIGISNAISSSTSSYQKVSSGFKTSINSSGQLSSTIIDASGQIIQSTDNSGTLDFEYQSNRLRTKVLLGVGTLVEMKYDYYGNQTKLLDNNAGTSEYEYNAYGQLINQKDANSNEYSMLYDIGGRITTKTNLNDPTDVINYQYVTSGNGLNKLKKESFLGTGTYFIDYTYNSYGQVLQSKESIDAQNYVTSYTYNSDGNNTSITYPSGFKVNYEYDNKGLLVKVKDNNSKTLFQNPTYNQFGQLTSYLLGNGISTVKTYDQYGVIQKIKAGSIFDMEFTMDLLKGNLTERKDLIHGLTETFTYDYLNRLTSEIKPLVPAVSVFYTSNGNIDYKTDVGKYLYNGTGTNALTSLSAFPSNSIARPGTPEQYIEYTNFDRATSVEEGDFKISLDYGTSRNRIKSVLEYQGNITKTRYYLQNYEEEIEGANHRKIHYINCGLGVTVYYIEENSVGDYYYPHTDYLGSVLAISDDLGVCKFKQSFDAWGQYREPTDWSNNITTTNISLTKDISWFYRGFTGHEHYPEFTLINMNNRMYDPEVGRMCAVDNFVKSPYTIQAYNRYTYAGNNPLKYTDPDGEWVHLVIGGVMGGVSGYMLGKSAGLEGWALFGTTMGGAAFGALSGGISSGIAASGGFMSHTLALVVGSQFTAIGNHFIGSAIGVNQDHTINLGVASVTFGKDGDEIGFLGKKKNSKLENLGYALGALANLSDIGKTGDMLYNVEKKDVISHAAIKETDGTTVISYGPKSGGKYSNLMQSQGKSNGTNPGKHYIKMFGGIRGTNAYGIHGDDIPLKGVNTTIIKGYAKALTYLADNNAMPYSFAYSSCSTHVGLALWFSGVPNIMLHPYTVQGSVWLWNHGITPALIQNSHHLTNKY
jgi:RHS repeat-associated protein